MSSRREPRAEPDRPRRGDGRARRGRIGERLAEAHLTARGYRCAARNLRTRFGEIDLLLRRGSLWVAVEVKTRSVDPAPENAVGDDTVARLRNALSRLAPHLEPRARRLRVDVVAVRLPRGEEPEVRHFPGDEFDAPPR